MDSPSFKIDTDTVSISQGATTPGTDEHTIEIAGKTKDDFLFRLIGRTTANIGDPDKTIRITQIMYGLPMSKDSNELSTVYDIVNAKDAEPKSKDFLGIEVKNHQLTSESLANIETLINSEKLTTGPFWNRKTIQLKSIFDNSPSLERSGDIGRVILAANQEASTLQQVAGLTLSAKESAALVPGRQQNNQTSLS